MRNKQRLFLIGGILSGVVALGCQAPPMMPPSQPRTVVYGGGVRFDADADMALVFERDCNDKGGYGLKQVSGGSLDPRIKNFHVRVSGPNLIKALEFDMGLDQFGTGCAATSAFYGVPDGTYTVEFQAVDQDGGTVAFAKDTVTIDAGQTLVKTVQCDFNTGKLAVQINCCNSPAPSPAPSASATPTPTPTPTASADPCSTVVSYWNGGYGVVDIGVGTDGTIYGAGQWITRLTPDGVYVDNLNGDAASSIAVDASGDIWYTTGDGAGWIVKKVNSAGVEYFSVNIGPIAAADPKLTIDQNGNVWAYYANSLDPYRLVKISPAGAILNSTTMGVGRPLPYAIEVDPSGNAWVTFQDGWIEKYDPSGNLFNSFDSGGNWPQDLTFDAQGNAWVVTQQNNTVSKWAPDNTLLGTFPVGNSPQSVIIDLNGNVWVSNTGGPPATKKLAPDGTELESLPCVGGYDMSLDANGNILVPTGGGNYIHRITP